MRQSFDATFYVFLAVAVASGVACYALSGPEAFLAAVRSAAVLIAFVAPQLVAGLLIGGLLQSMIDRAWMERTLGGSSGLRGLVIASFGGAITPSGPFASFPLVLALWKAGADAGVLVAYIAGWALIGVHRVLVWEIPFLGPEFSFFRFVLGLPMPLLAGLIARAIVARTRLLDGAARGDVQ